MTTVQRPNPFGDLDDFAPSPKGAAKPVDPKTIEVLSQGHGFPSRAPVRPAPASTASPTPAATPTQQPRVARRYYTTGRNQQINLKATPETVAKMNELANRDEVSLAELLERALAAYERSTSAS